MKLTWGGRPYKNTERKRNSIQAHLSGTQVKSETPDDFNSSGSTPTTSIQSLLFVVEDLAPKKKKRGNSSGKVYESEMTQSKSDSFVRVEPTTMKRTLTDFKDNSSKFLREVSPLNTPQEEALLNSFSMQDGPDKYSLVDIFPGISDGIESLSQALENISGGNLFNIQNSEIFNSFVLSNIDHPMIEENESLREAANPVTETKPSIPVASTKMNWESHQLDNYSSDLAKIEKVLPPRSKYIAAEFLADSTEPLPTSVPKYSPDWQKEIGLQTNKTPVPYTFSTLEAFEPIPAQITPLPDILLQVPYYRGLFHFWVNVASDLLVPAPSKLYHENPFKVILPRMAMESQSILTTLLAFSASVKEQYTTSSCEQSKVIIEQLLTRSCSELLKLLQDKKQATSDAALATVLLLSCIEVSTGGDFDRHRAHTIGARQIILSRGLRLPTERLQLSSTRDQDNQDKNDFDKELKDSIDAPITPGLVISVSEASTSESDVTFFLMRWFAYVDVIGALSATKKSHNYLSYKQSEDLFNDPSSMEKILAKSGHIDHLLGFDLDFLPLLADIALLIRKTNAYLSTSNSSPDMLPLSIISKAMEVKEYMTTAYAVGESKRQARVDRTVQKQQQQKEKLEGPNCSPANVSGILEKDSVLRSVNKIFFNMGLLNLYRRVLMVDRKSFLVQDLCEEIGDTLQLNIEPKSPAEICSIFCTFCAACETTNPEMQALFHARFTTLEEMGLSNATSVLQIMEKCWETGSEWMKVATELDIDFTLL